MGAPCLSQIFPAEANGTEVHLGNKDASIAGQARVPSARVRLARVWMGWMEGESGCQGHLDSQSRFCRPKP